MFKWKFCYTEFSNLLQSTINAPKSNRQPQFTLHHLFEDGVLFFCFDLRVSLCWQQLQNESQQFVSCSHVSFVNFALQPNPTNQIYRSLFWRHEQLHNGNHAELDRRSYELFRTMSILSPSNTLIFPLESSCMSLLLICTQFLKLHILRIDIQNLFSAWKWLLQAETCSRVHFVIRNLNISISIFYCNCIIKCSYHCDVGS